MSSPPPPPPLPKHTRYKKIESFHGIQSKPRGGPGPSRLVPTSAAYSALTSSIENGDLNVCWLCARLSLFGMHLAPFGVSFPAIVISFTTGSFFASWSRVEPSALGTRLFSSCVPSLSSSVFGNSVKRSCSPLSPVEEARSSSPTRSSFLVRDASVSEPSGRSPALGVA